MLAALVHESPRREPVRGGYRVLLRDRAFLHLAAADVAMIAVGWGVFSWLLPPFARDQIGVSTSLIWLLLLANAMAVVVAQVPVARFAEGRRRALTMALAGALFCGACLLVEVADASRAISSGRVGGALDLHVGQLREGAAQTRPAVVMRARPVAVCDRRHLMLRALTDG